MNLNWIMSSVPHWIDVDCCAKTALMGLPNNQPPVYSGQTYLSHVWPLHRGSNEFPNIHVHITTASMQACSQGEGWWNLAVSQQWRMKLSAVCSCLTVYTFKGFFREQAIAAPGTLSPCPASPLPSLITNGLQTQGNTKQHVAYPMIL